MPSAVTVYHVHLLHELVISQVRKTFCDFRIVERQKGQTSPAGVPTSKLLDLRPTKSTMTVENNNVGLWTLRRGRKRRGVGWGRLGCHGNAAHAVQGSYAKSSTFIGPQFQEGYNAG